MSDKPSVYFDCIIFKETASGKKRAIRIGSAKQRDDGGFQVYLDALPTGEGQFAILPQRAQDQQRTARPKRTELEDEIPF